MGRGMEFADKISIVTKARLPVDDELVLSDAVADPVKAYVDGFSGFLFDAIVGKADGGGVVNLDSDGWLGVTHFGECHAEG